MASERWWAYNSPTPWQQRFALRLIGVGVILLSDSPWRALREHTGRIWNLGCFMLNNQRDLKVQSTPSMPSGSTVTMTPSQIDAAHASGLLNFTEAPADA